MEDSQIIDLFCGRSQNAVAAAAEKYGTYCHSIAYNILENFEDSEECVNDTYLRTWETIPPLIPASLKAYLGRITRNLSLDRFRRTNACKRGGGNVNAALEELGDAVPGDNSSDQVTEQIVLRDALNEFLGGLTPQKRKLFLRRYWYFCPIKELAADFGMSESKVKMTLLRLRQELKQHLEQEGICL